MNNLIELTSEEATNTEGGYFLGPMVFNLVGFMNDIISGFNDGANAATKAK
jgi:thioredoxin reductase